MRIARSVSAAAGASAVINTPARNAPSRPPARHPPTIEVVSSMTTNWSAYPPVVPDQMRFRLPPRPREDRRDQRRAVKEISPNSPPWRRVFGVLAERESQKGNTAHTPPPPPPGKDKTPPRPRHRATRSEQREHHRITGSVMAAAKPRWKTVHHIRGLISQNGWLPHRTERARRDTYSARTPTAFRRSISYRPEPSRRHRLTTLRAITPTNNPRRTRTATLTAPGLVRPGSGSTTVVIRRGWRLPHRLDQRLAIAATAH